MHDVVTSCPPQESCPFCDVKEGVFRSGENWTDSTDPCVRYHCNQGRVEEERLDTKCEKIEECLDGKAPFHVRGECCLQCRKCTAHLMKRCISSFP